MLTPQPKNEPFLISSVLCPHLTATATASQCIPAFQLLVCCSTAPFMWLFSMLCRTAGKRPPLRRSIRARETRMKCRNGGERRHWSYRKATRRTMNQRPKDRHREPVKKSADAFIKKLAESFQINRKTCSKLQTGMRQTRRYYPVKKWFLSASSDLNRAAVLLWLWYTKITVAWGYQNS